MIQTHILNDQQCRSKSVGFFGSQLNWIYTVCKGMVNLGSAGAGLRQISLGCKKKNLNIQHIEHIAGQFCEVYKTLHSSSVSFSNQKVQPKSSTTDLPQVYFLFSAKTIFFLFLPRNIMLWVIRSALQGVSDEYPQTLF